MLLRTEPFLFRELRLKHSNYTSASLLWGCYKPSAELAQHSLRSAQKQREMCSKNGDKATCWWQGHLSGKNICRKLPGHLNFRTFLLPTQAIGHSNSFQATCEGFGFVATAWTSLTSNIIIGQQLFNIKLTLISKPFCRFHLGLIKSNIPASISEAPKQYPKNPQTFPGMQSTALASEKPQCRKIHIQVLFSGNSVTLSGELRQNQNNLWTFSRQDNSSSSNLGINLANTMRPFATCY